MEKTNVSTLPKRQVSLNRVALAAGTAVMTGGAFAAGDFDMTSASTLLAGVLVAVATLGAVKIAPAAAAWGWAMLTRTASR